MARLTFVNDGTGASAAFHLESPEETPPPVLVMDGGRAVLPLPDARVSTAERWMAYAIVNGITTEVMRLPGTDAVVTVRPDGEGGYALSVA